MVIFQVAVNSAAGAVWLGSSCYQYVLVPLGAGAVWLAGATYNYLLLPCCNVSLAVGRCLAQAGLTGAIQDRISAW